MQNWTNFYTLFSLIITLTALISYLNIRYFKIPATIATMAGALLISSALLFITTQLGLVQFREYIHQQLSTLDFHSILMQGMLSLLLFAGSLQVNLAHLQRHQREVLTLALGSTLLSTFLIGIVFYYALPFLGFALPFLYCLLFGALISPTDPIAVLAIFQKVKASPVLNITVTGESLLNDGVGIVIFLTIYQLTFHEVQPTVFSVTTLFLQAAVGGFCYGILLGVIGKRLIHSIADLKVQILITLAITTGGYIFAEMLGISGPLAMVSAGIMIGNKDKKYPAASPTREQLKQYWELVDEILNAVLFFLIGLQLLTITHTVNELWASLFAIPAILLVRFITVGVPISLFKLKGKYPPFFVSILTWGGLRGGLAVALALSLPNDVYSHLIVSITYAVVIFSILVQGLSTKPLVMLGKRYDNRKQKPHSAI